MYDVLAAVISGGAIKVVDFIEDERAGKGFIKWIMALVAGLSYSFLLSFSPAASLFLAIIAAQVFMAKVDRVAHGLAVMVAVVLSLFYGIGAIDMWYLLAFFMLACIDEIPLTGDLARLGEYRLWLKGGALCIGLITGAWAYFILLMAFDMAYLAAAHYMGERIRPMRRR